MGSSGALRIDSANLVAVGEETFARDLCTSASSITMSTQTLRLTYFTARKTETSTQVRVSTGATAAAATPSLCRVGLYTIAANGDGALVASIANDTTLFAAANTGYTRSWSVSYAKLSGQRYALGLLVVTAAAAPTMAGAAITPGAEAAIAPVLAGFISAQADLPSTFVNGSVSASGSRIYGVVLP